jgi:1,3-beta-glucan synthase
MLVIFIVLIAGPLIVKRLGMNKTISKSLWGTIGLTASSTSNTMFLLQPMDSGLNDTETYYTGSNLPKGDPSMAESSITNPTASGTYVDFKLI